MTLIISDVLDDVAQRAHLPVDLVLEIRREWGGREVYIRSARDDIRTVIRGSTAPVAALAAQYRMHPNSIRRIKRK
jgi:hypothetical protein